ncbi:Uncharacterized conserved protein MJ1445 [Commensalibacter communis]|uniref:metallophosphoesterase family protein n=1 Tax=Commensalibacter communis TaxID=2972786 RepID=UPI0022FFBE5A|nr:metallophosphoesterase family protein [Commensalibacter communis]CAI3955905.1 Uncharacterized conserved protein MJ1445 [Commensalibacter communis]
MTTWFTSDTHFDHKSIITLCNRPFNNVEEMNQTLILNWNKSVKPEDEIYHLGDVCWSKDASPLLSQLNGKKHLIIGNHDSKAIQGASEWTSVHQYKELKIEGTHVVLFHYPIREWAGFYRGSIHLYGHVHGSIEPYENAYDVGVDVCNFAPVDLHSLLKEKITPS